MDLLFAIGAFLVGGACGQVLGHAQAHAKLEPLFQDLRRQVHEALQNLAELERQEGPKIEARILERMWKKCLPRHSDWRT